MGRGGSTEIPHCGGIKRLVDIIGNVSEQKSRGEPSGRESLRKKAGRI